MSLDLCITNRNTNESSFLPICSSQTFRERWLPIAERFDLDMITCLPALTITEEFREQFLNELQTLHTWFSSPEAGEAREIVKSIERLSTTVKETSLTEFDLSTG